jgi:hypothetical protein
MVRAISVSLGNASRNSGDSLRLPGAVTNGDVAVAIAEGDDLAALEMLVSAIPEVVAAFRLTVNRQCDLDRPAGALRS